MAAPYMIDVPNTWDNLSVNLPFYPLLEMISNFLQIPYGATEAIYIYFVLALLPSLMMLAGMMAKKEEDNLNKRESKIMIFFKNQVNKFKKEL